MCKPDWDFWKHKTTVEKWQAAFLSCDIDPDTQSYRDIKHYGLDNEKVSKRLRLLKDNSHLRVFFSPSIIDIGDSNLSHVKLSEFALWCIDRGYDIPKELAALAKKPGAATDAEIKTRVDWKLAFIKKCIRKEIPPDIESIWQHILENVGNDGFLFERASKSTATSVYGKEVEKDKLNRQLLNYLKKAKNK